MTPMVYTFVFSLYISLPVFSIIIFLQLQSFLSFKFNYLWIERETILTIFWINQVTVDESLFPPYMSQLQMAHTSRSRYFIQFD